MRYKKCDFCGLLFAKEDEAYNSFADVTVDTGNDFDTFEFCGDCAETIVKICKKTRGEEK